jgi:hypothetical protein
MATVTNYNPYSSTSGDNGWVYYNYTNVGSATLNLSANLMLNKTFYCLIAGCGGNGDSGSNTGYGGKSCLTSLFSKILTTNVTYNISISANSTGGTKSSITDATGSLIGSALNGANAVSSAVLASQKKYMTVSFNDSNTNSLILLGGDGGHGGTMNNAAYTDGVDGYGGGGGAAGNDTGKHNGGAGTNGNWGGNTTRADKKSQKPYTNGGGGGGGFKFSGGGVGGGGGGGGGGTNKNGEGGIGGTGAIMIYYKKA